MNNRLKSSPCHFNTVWRGDHRNVNIVGVKVTEVRALLLGVCLVGIRYTLYEDNGEDRAFGMHDDCISQSFPYSVYYLLPPGSLLPLVRYLCVYALVSVITVKSNQNLIVCNMIEMQAHSYAHN